jgi:hypothetical protein
MRTDALYQAKYLSVGFVTGVTDVSDLFRHSYEHNYFGLIWNLKVDSCNIHERGETKNEKNLYSFVYDNVCSAMCRISCVS